MVLKKYFPIEHPRISIIIPVYNVEKYIERCARSLFEQTLSDIEYIFVNDGSTDASIAILENVILDYPERKSQIHILNQVNKGVSVARNKGLEIAKGDYIAFCDSDDWVSYDMYEKLYDRAVLFQADVVYCDFYMFYGDVGTKVYKTKSLTNSKVDFLCSYISSYTVLWNMIVKRDLYEKHKLCFPIHIRYREDFHLSIRIYYYAQKIEKINEPLYYYNKLNLNSALYNRSRRQFNDELTCDLDIISFFSKQGVINQYKDKLSWGILRDKQTLVLDPDKHNEFLSIYPESHMYIWSCPYINVKIKIMMWLLVHHFGFLVRIINRLRNVIKNICR